MTRNQSKLIANAQPFTVELDVRHLSDIQPVAGAITAIGNASLLQDRKVGLFCSVKCPGNLILQTYDLAQKLRNEGATVISGFHSPMEQECLHILLKGKSNLIICPARSVDAMRIRTELKRPLEEGRLLILSPFKQGQDRTTARNADIRNLFVADVADIVFVTYASPGGKTEVFCSTVLGWNKSLCTFVSDYNSNLITMGACSLTLDGVKQLMNQAD